MTDAVDTMRSERSPMTIPDESMALFERVTVAAISDVLDEIGHRDQTMHQRLRPLDPDNCRFVGRARTARWMETDYVIEGDPYGLEIDLMDSLGPGEVVVHSTDHAGTNAPWGELMSTIAQVRGVVGCVCDSQIRDCNQIRAIGLPVFYRGIRPLDSKGRGRVMAYDVPVRSGDVLVHPGDIVFADFDGIVVIPQAVEGRVLELAEAKVSKENLSRQELKDGALLRDVFARHGVL
jgi:regulator of RNase E activity RraA